MSTVPVKLVSAYLDSGRVCGEAEEPLRWSVKDPPVVVHARHPVRTPRDDTLHHVGGHTSSTQTEPDRTAYYN